ncbi:ubiquinol-cytochrome-c reductase complex assembly factor 1 [Anopheles bellator]|uniref:ubiquinol-cytochrome-c reductase complex assembly factor 1 n=1 Tax=Anopheles bellator TaxID=139047 RepID=UPI002649E4C8|nr:ubiquinol-cytochrome-c reductase complex assembly factor 1 [Anopheles bellator]
MLRTTSRFAASLQQEIRPIFVLPRTRSIWSLKENGRRPHEQCHRLRQRRLLSTSPALRSVSTYGEGTESKDGFLKRFIAKMGWIDNSAVRLRVSSCLLYESVADSIDYSEFFTRFDMPDTFNTWFLITELHVWMLLVRSMAEGAEKGAAGRFLRNCIVETMWNDVTTRAKQLTMDNPSVVRPQIQQLSEQFQAALISYDEGLSYDDKALAAALWRRFLGGRCEDYQRLELLVEYVRKQAAMLDQLSRYDFAIKPNIKWRPLVDKKDVA